MALTSVPNLKDALERIETFHPPLNIINKLVETLKPLEYPVPEEFTRTIQKLSQVLEASSLVEATQQVIKHLAFLNTPVKKKVSTLWGDIYLPVIVIEPTLNGCVLNVNYKKTKLKPSLAALLGYLWDENNHSVAELIKAVYGSNFNAKDLRAKLSKRLSELNDRLDEAFGHSRSKHGLKRRWIERVRDAEGSFYHLMKPGGKNWGKSSEC